MFGALITKDYGGLSVRNSGTFLISISECLCMEIYNIVAANRGQISMKYGIFKMHAMGYIHRDTLGIHCIREGMPNELIYNLLTMIRSAFQ